MKTRKQTEDKKQVKEKKAGKATKGRKQSQEMKQTAEARSSAAGRPAQATAKAKPKEPVVPQAGPAPSSSSGAVMPRVEGKLAGRAEPGERSVMAAKPPVRKTPEEKPAVREAATGAKAPASAATAEKPRAAAAAARPAQPKPAEEPISPGIRKEYLSTRGVCKVTFTLPAAAAPSARKVNVVGDFNDWNRESTSLKRQDNGDFAVTLDLHAGREYRFRYLIDGQRWENDWRADKYVKNPYGVDDSVVSV